MPCKHEGGTDDCVKYAFGACKAKMGLTSRRWYRDNRDRRLKAGARYQKKYLGSLFNKKKSGDAGYTGELIVRTDLLLKDLEVMVPENRSSPDDLHFKAGRKWFSVQVKVARINAMTGTWTCYSHKPITSDLIAWVNLWAREVRYAPNTKGLPPELRA